MRPNFPQSLNGAPALLPAAEHGNAGCVGDMVRLERKSPRLVGEFEDSALMEVCSAGGRGFTAVHTVVDRTALKHYGLRVIAKVEECGKRVLCDHRRAAGETSGGCRDH